MATRLPVPLTTFVGRASDLDDLARQLQEHRQVTVVGVGGVGKTRLAAELARAVADRFPDGVYWADLAPVTDPTWS